MEVVNNLKCYEVNGQETEGTDYPILKIKSHWNFSDRVVIETPTGEKMTVLGQDILNAVTNARNHR